MAPRQVQQWLQGLLHRRVLLDNLLERAHKLLPREEAIGAHSGRGGPLVVGHSDGVEQAGDGGGEARGEHRHRLLPLLQRQLVRVEAKEKLRDHGLHIVLVPCHHGVGGGEGGVEARAEPQLYGGGPPELGEDTFEGGGPPHRREVVQLEVRDEVAGRHGEALGHAELDDACGGGEERHDHLHDLHLGVGHVARVVAAILHEVLDQLAGGDRQQPRGILLVLQEARLGVDPKPRPQGFLLRVDDVAGAVQLHEDAAVA
mmetsp:Transcript_29724/g.95553  ORF Transcript_29724/g.95553 Transcript_29724/m.95553 type:complete len:258 (+) Transcript_29724:834-1607(+)